MSGSGARWSRRIRGTHRWTSVVFTGVVAFVTLVSVRGDEAAEWVYYLPLPFLGVLLLTGLYLFALPYLARRRSEGDGHVGGPVREQGAEAGGGAAR